MSFPHEKVSGRGMKLTDGIRSYIAEKLRKNERVLGSALSIEVECIRHLAARGVDQDFEVEIVLALPRETVRVSKRASSIRAAVDEAVDVATRNIKRYKEKMRKWENASRDNSVRDEAERPVETEGPEVIPYKPVISERAKLEDCTPVSEDEAIEKMELLGYESLLFRNKANGRYCMVYRRSDGTYGILEPCED